MRHLTVVVFLALAFAGCSTPSATPTTMGVDGAPQLIRDAFVTVARQAATLADYDASNEEWLSFARDVCGAELASSADVADFVAERAGSAATPAASQMWSTATTAATTSFCPIG